jgi:predicted cation transporter
VRLKSVSVSGGASAEPAGEPLVTHATALIDTGTTYLILPRGDFASVATALGATCWFSHDGEGAHKGEGAFVAMKCEAVQVARSWVYIREKGMVSEAFQVWIPG